MSAAAPTTAELKAEKKQFVEGAAAKFFGGAASPVIPEPEPIPEAGSPPPVAPPEPAPAPVVPPAVVQPAPPAPPAEPAKPPVAAAPPEPPKPSLAPPAPALDARDIETAVERALDKHTPAAPAPAPAAPAMKFSRKDEYTLTVLRKMEVLQPTYVGLADRTIQFWNDEQSFIEAFVKANPDRAKEVAKSEEYEAWLEQHEPQYDEFDFKQAENALLKDEVRAEEDAKRRESERKMSDKQRLIQDQPVIQQLAYQAVTQCVVNTLKGEDGKLSPELEAIFVKDGKIVVDQAASEKLAEEDPVAYQVLLKYSERLNLSVQAMETLARYPEAPRKKVQLQYSKGTMSPTDTVAEDADEFESRMLKLPKDKTTIEGRVLISQEDYFRESSKIQAAKMSDEKKRDAGQKFSDKYYCLGVDEIRAGLSMLYSERAREEINSLNEVVNRKVKKATPVAPPAPPEPAPTIPVVPAATTDKVHSPAVVSRSDVPDPTKVPVNTKDEDLRNINNKMWGR